MKIIDNFDQINEAGERKQFPVGPQPCVITEVEDDAAKSLLIVKFDIVKGEQKGHFKTVYESTGKWYGVSYRSYKDAALPFFKSFITAIEKSNVGYKWNWDERTLVGKYVIVNFREEEYVYDGEVRASVKPFEFRSIEALNKGEVEKEPKRLTLKDQGIAEPTAKAESNFDIVEEDLPF